MSNEPLGTVAQFLKGLAEEPCFTNLSDAQLLELFSQRRDEASFRILVQRHGPMVMAVCRRVLQNEHAAEDAFQATFLVLAQRPGSIHRTERLGSWLYGVAYRTALKARSKHSSRKQTDSIPDDLTGGSDPLEVLAWREMQAIFDEEVQRLPEQFRLPVILCYLQGLTWNEAARSLGWPLGTVAGRLAKAKERLRLRLQNRGFALSAGLLTTLMAQNSLLAEVPGALLSTTTKIGALGLSQAIKANAISPIAATLTQEVLSTMIAAKAKTVALSCVLFLVLGLGSGGAYLHLRAAQGNGYQIANDESAPPKKAQTPAEIQKRLQAIEKEKQQLQERLKKSKIAEDKKPEKSRRYIPLVGYSVIEEAEPKMSKEEMDQLAQQAQKTLEAGDYRKAQQLLNKLVKAREDAARTEALRRMKSALAVVNKATANDQRAARTVLDFEKMFQSFQNQLNNPGRWTEFSPKYNLPGSFYRDGRLTPSGGNQSPPAEGGSGQ